MTGTENIDKTQLPARPPLDGEFGPVPSIDEIREGDLVAIYSRGAERVAMVEKIGRTNLGCVYTTKGAWDTAQKCYEWALARNPEAEARAASSPTGVEARNYAHTVRECDATTARFAVANAWTTEEAAEAKRAENRERLASYGTLDEYLARKGDEAREGAAASKQKAIEGGVAQYVHVTRKNVKLADVIGWKRAA